MSLIARATTVVGLVLLLHAGYSAHEHTTLQSHLHHASSSSSSLVPLDITIETIVSVILVSIGIVLSAEQLKPISWSTWAGKIEKEGGYGNPYRGLEERPGFLDIRAKRREFAAWVQEKDTIVKS